MSKEWFDYGEITSKEIYESLSVKEQSLLNDFKDYLLISASQQRAEEGIREILRFKEITGKLFDINLKDLRDFLKELKQSSFADHTKNKIKNYIQRFLKWGFKDWSERFSNFEDIKFNANAQNKKQINYKTLLTDDDVKKLLEAEPSLYWKTFLMTQAEGGLRTIETRELLWSNVDFQDDGFTILNIPSKKNRNGSVKINPVVLKIAGRFLKELKEQQDKYEIKTKWVFPSPKDSNKPISKAVNLWFNTLCKKALGRSGNNYLLRHKKGTELQEKIRNGTLSKDNALTFMRHSGKMFDKTYSHMDEKAITQLIKKQIYNTKALTQEEKDELKNLKVDFNKLKKGFQASLNLIKFLANQNLEQVNKKGKADPELLRLTDELKAYF